MADVVITEFMDDAAVAELAARFDTLYDPKLVDQPERLLREVANARAVIVRNRTQVRGSLLLAAERLVAVGRLGVGLDNIDVAACTARGVGVFPATGANDVSVAEYVMAGALMLLRGAYFATAEVADGTWPRTRLMGRECFQRTLGLVGFGAIARHVARRAQAFDMTILAYDPFLSPDDPALAAHGAQLVGLEALLAASDVVSLHVPLTEATTHLINAERLATMKSTTILINAARGGVVDEAALADALRAKRLGGAMLDVFATEPLPGGGPLVGVPNLILTPHIAGVTEESNVRVSTMIAAKIAEALA